MNKISFKKYLLVNAIGFGFGGLLWGLVLYSELPDLDYPFHFLTIFIMGLFGGISLAWLDKSVVNISKSVIAGFLGWLVGLVAVPVVTYFFFMYGVILLSLAPFYFIEVEVLDRLINLSPDIYIGDIWTVFVLVGVIVALSYSLFLKTRKWSLIWRGGLGLGLASLISPIIGNLIGNACDCLLVNYLITFSLMGIILGLFLSWGAYKKV